MGAYGFGVFFCFGFSTWKPLKTVGKIQQLRVIQALGLTSLQTSDLQKNPQKELFSSQKGQSVSHKNNRC